METTRRLALMIDGDNAQAALLPQMLAEVSKYGVLTIRRVYGDWSAPQLKSWKEVMHAYAIKAEQQFSYTSGKNATDIALIIDAMDIIHSAEVDGICIVSSDSDFTPLALRLREKNLFVMGIGRRETLPAFVNACNVFIYTDNLTAAEPPAVPEKITAEVGEKTAAAADNKVADITRLKKLFRTAFDLAVQEDGWAHLAVIGGFLRQIDPGFDPRTYGHKQLSQLVQAYPDFIEVRKTKVNGKNDVISVRPTGKKSPAKKASAS